MIAKNKSRTKIIATLGPVTNQAKTIAELIKAGVDVFRLNFSHGNDQEKIALTNLIRKESKKLNQPTAIIADLSGPKIRLGKIPGDSVYLEGKSTVTLTTRMSPLTDAIPVDFPKLNRVVKPQDKILLKDGSVVLKVKSVKDKNIVCRVLDGGKITSHSGVNLPNKDLDLPAITPKDKKDLKVALKAGADFVALSFVNSSKDIVKLKNLIKKDGQHKPIIAKIERAVALDNIDPIVEVADAVMIARGDLGIEVPPEEVPIIQKKLIKKITRIGKPVITATQMLESMTENTFPTRAEASDVANAIFDGTDAIMLSGETAVGKYPVEAVKTMSKIAKRAEKELPYRDLLKQRLSWSISTTTEAISFSTCELASNLKASAIITSTHSGNTARQVSKFRPKTSILAVSPRIDTIRQLKLTWGVTPILAKPSKNIDEMFDTCVTRSLEKKLIKKGDRVIITAGVMVNVPGTTNLLKVHKIPKQRGKFEL